MTTHPPIWLLFLEDLVIPLSILIPILYAWATVIFLFFRLRRPETEESLKRYLDLHRAFFVRSARRARGEKLGPPIPGADFTGIPVTRDDMKNTGAGGWAFVGLAATGVMVHHHVNLWSVLLAVALLFFGGLFRAYGWYGQRCLRLLNLQSY